MATINLDKILKYCSLKAHNLSIEYKNTLKTAIKLIERNNNCEHDLEQRFYVMTAKNNDTKFYFRLEITPNCEIFDEDDDEEHEDDIYYNSNKHHTKFRIGQNPFVLIRFHLQCENQYLNSKWYTIGDLTLKKLMKLKEKIEFFLQKKKCLTCNHHLRLYEIYDEESKQCEDCLGCVANHCNCSICLDEEKVTRISTMSCGHKFHYDCIYKYFTQSNEPKCPLCRDKLGFPHPDIKTLEL